MFPVTPGEHRNVEHRSPVEAPAWRGRTGKALLNDLRLIRSSSSLILGRLAFSPRYSY